MSEIVKDTSKSDYDDKTKYEVSGDPRWDVVSNNRELSADVIIPEGSFNVELVNSVLAAHNLEDGVEGRLVPTPTEEYPHLKTVFLLVDGTVSIDEQTGAIVIKDSSRTTSYPIGFLNPDSLMSKTLEGVVKQQRRIVIYTYNNSLSITTDMSTLPTFNQTKDLYFVQLDWSIINETSLYDVTYGFLKEDVKSEFGDKAILYAASIFKNQVMDAAQIVLKFKNETFENIINMLNELGYDDDIAHLIIKTPDVFFKEHPGYAEYEKMKHSLSYSDENERGIDKVVINELYKDNPEISSIVAIHKKKDLLVYSDDENTFRGTIEGARQNDKSNNGLLNDGQDQIDNKERWS